MQPQATSDRKRTNKRREAIKGTSHLDARAAIALQVTEEILFAGVSRRKV